MLGVPQGLVPVSRSSGQAQANPPSCTTRYRAHSRSLLDANDAVVPALGDDGGRAELGGELLPRVARHGTPQRPEELIRHECITFRSQTTGARELAVRRV